MGHRGSPCPGGVRLTAWASAASTDCSASPRRSRPLRALGERGRAAGSAHLSGPALYPRLCLLRSPPARPQVEPLLKTGTTFGAGRDPRYRMAPRNRWGSRGWPGSHDQWHLLGAGGLEPELSLPHWCPRV